jgi:O-antigen/teichoic acid export membrane protein
MINEPARAPGDAEPHEANERPHRRPRTPWEKIKKRLGGMLLRGALRSLVIQILGAGLGVAVQAFLAHVLGAERFGHYAYTLTLLSVFAVFARMGLDTGTVRFVAAYQASGQIGLMRGFLRRTWRTGFFASLVVAAVVAAGAYALKSLGKLDDELFELFLLLALLLPINARFEISNSALLAFKQVVRAKAPGSLLRPLLIAGTVYVLARVLGRDVDAAGLMWIYIGSGVALSLVNGLFLWRALPEGYSSAAVEERLDEWRKTVVPFLVLAALGMLNNSIDMILIGPLRGTTEAGLYAVPTRLVKLISFGLIAVNSMFPAMISELHSQQKMAELQRLVTLSARVACAFTVPVSLVLIFGGRYILSFYPPEFQASYWPMAILSIGQIVNAATGSVGFLLAMTGRERVSMRILAASLALNVVANLALVPRYGMLGAAVGTTVAMTAWNVAMVVAVRRSLGVMPSALGGRYVPRS